MLFRRFTVVCLMIALFGVALSVAVTEAGRPARGWQRGAVVACAAEPGTTCPAHGLPIKEPTR